jgi:hypothetical protein
MYEKLQRRDLAPLSLDRIKNTVLTLFKMSSPPPAKYQKLSSIDLNSDLLHLFESGDLYDCTFKVGRDDLESGCKVSNIYLTTYLE